MSTRFDATRCDLRVWVVHLGLFAVRLFDVLHAGVLVNFEVQPRALLAVRVQRIHKFLLKLLPSVPLQALPDENQTERERMTQ